MYKLYNGDCLEIMPTLESGSIDAIITDLPYGTTACKWDAIIPFEQMWREVKRVLKPNGAFVTTASQPFTSALVMSNPKWFKYEWIWEKSRSTDFINAKNKPMKRHENILVFSSGTTANKSNRRMIYNPQGIIKNTTYQYRPSPKMRNGGVIGERPSHVRGYTREYENYPDSVLSFSNPNHSLIHPTQKPIELYEYLIRTYTNEGETVLDITMGSGTTIIAAELTGRNSIGIEKDPDIFKTAQDRILNMYNAPKKVKKPKSDNGLQMELV